MISREAVIFYCAMAWGKSPDEIHERIKDGRLSMGTLVKGARMYATTFPFSADSILNKIYPGRAIAIQKMEHEKQVQADFEALIAYRDSQRQGTEKTKDKG